jgi:predicted site-specific integrase-resolvase
MATTQSSSPSLSPQEARQRIAIYARVSTLHNQNPEMQLAELREYAARRGWEVTC